ncbi:MAG: RNA polymerase sigma factor, partial [Phycisphaeraceae bacterium JB051]
WVHDRHQAQDILQEVFLRLHRSCQLKTVTRQTNLRAYLFTIARNCVIDHYRSQDSQQRKLAEHAAMAHPQEIVDPHETLVKRESVQRAQNCLSLLPIEQREAITLQVHSGLKLREIAEVLGIPLGTVKTRIRMGLKKLHQQLNEQEAKHV